MHTHVISMYAGDHSRIGTTENERCIMSRYKRLCMKLAGGRSSQWGVSCQRKGGVKAYRWTPAGGQLDYRFS